MIVSVCKSFRFDAAHFLPNCVGKCRNMHGHGWTLEVKVHGEVNSHTGMVVDFKDLKSVVRRYIEELDHTLLNDTIVNPTAENLCIWLFEPLSRDLLPLVLESLVLYETPDSYAEVRNG